MIRLQNNSSTKFRFGSDACSEMTSASGTGLTNDSLQNLIKPSSFPPICKDKEFNLENDGDLIEKDNYKFINTNIPYYLTFWQKFVTPLTNRVLDPGRENGMKLSEWIKIRPNVEKLPYEITVCHYSVLVHYIASYKFLLSGLSKLEDFYIRLGCCNEMILRLCFLVYCESRLCRSKNKEVLAATQEYLKTFWDTGRVKSHLHEVKEDKKFGLGKTVDEYLEKTKSISSDNDSSTYRNFIVHYPIIGRMGDPAHPTIPSLSALKKFASWYDIENSPTNSPSDWVDAEEQMKADFKDFTDALNILWPELIAKMDIIFKSNVYKQSVGID